MKTVDYDSKYRVTLPSGKVIIQSRFSAVARAKALGCALPKKVGHVVTASYKDTTFAYVVTTSEDGRVNYTQQTVEVVRTITIELLPKKHAASKG